MAFFRFRKEYDENDPGNSPLLDLQRRLKEWNDKRRKPTLDVPPAQTTDGTTVESSTTEAAIPARTQEVIMTQSLPPKKGKPTTDDRPTVHLKISADIPEGTIVNIRMEVVDAEGKVSFQRGTVSADTGGGVISPIHEKRAPIQPLTKIRQWGGTQIQWMKNNTRNLQRTFFWAAVVIYALVISIGIDRFPIYFFTDEAVHMNFIADFMTNGFQNCYEEFLPTFFCVRGEGWVNGTSVYVQLIPYLLFGKSVVVTRLVSAFFTLLAAIAIGLLLKKVLRVKYYWAGIFLLLTTPAWFLHARTAFEYAEVGAFYAIFLYFYGCYRKGDLRSLYFAIIAGALCFYTHGLGQILMGVTGLALFIVDFRYHIHRRQRKTVLLGLLLAIILLLPFARYYLAHPTEAADQVKKRGSYWSLPDEALPLHGKILEFFKQYTLGLNPWYWFTPHNGIDFDRHRMLGWGNGLWITLPFVVVGLFQIFKSVRNPIYRVAILALLASPILPSTIIHGGFENGPMFSIPIETIQIVLWLSIPLFLIGIFLALISIRRPGHRLALIALLACPIPASVAAIGMPRMLWMSVPLAILAAVGLSAVVQWIEKLIEERRQASSPWPGWVLFAALTLLSVFMLRSALVDGPRWFEDYSLYGMQFGAPQVFRDTVLPELKNDPNLQIIVSPSWANGTEQFIPFFIPDEYRSRVRFGQPADPTYIDMLVAGTPRLLFVTTADEYNNLLQDPKFKELIVHKVIPYPNEQPGFYLISAVPADNIKEIMIAQHEQNRRPIENTMVFRGETIRVIHSPLSAGQMEDNFDSDPETFTRILEANPYVIDLYPLTPIDTHSLFIKTGSLHDLTITIRLYAPGATEPVEYIQSYKDEPDKPLVPDPEFTIVFDRGPEKSERIYIEVKDNVTGETSQIHLRTIQFE
jgi:MFS family permease